MKLMLLGLLFCLNASASVTLPFTYGSNVPPSQANANDQALRDEINAHEAAHNAHNTSLSDILSVGSTVGAYSINFNGKELFNALVEKVTVDPTCSTASTVKGRLIFNTIDGLLKFCDGSSFISIAGTGVNTLSSVLSAGNSAGSSNINLNLHQLLNTRLENLGSDPSAASAGRIWWNTVDQAFRLDTGSSILTLGGSQGLSSVLGVSNSAGSTSLNMNGNSILNFKIDMLASAPSAAEARVYYDTSAHKLKFYNGTAWLEIGNTNTLAQTMALGNSVGSTDLNMNSRQLLSARLENTASPPGTGSAGRIWYDTGSDQIQFETAGASNRTVATLDNAQTLTNKTISGSSNTITNIQDSSLSANACLLNANQTVSGTKTFSASPIVSSLKTPSGAVHTLTDGLANDTFTLNNAVQTLAGKTLQSPTLSGNLDAAYYQATHFRLENLSATPSSGHAGRMIYKTSTGEVQYDTGSSWLTFQSNNPSALGWGLGGNGGLDATTNFFGTSDAVDVVMKANGSEILRLVSGGGIKTQLGSGLVKSSSGTLALAASGTDYAPATSGSAIQKGNGSGGFSSAVSGTDYAPATSGSAILKGNGAGGFSSAASGTDYAPATATTSALKGNGSGGFSAAASTDLSDTANIDLLNTAQTFTAAKVNSVAGAASTPAMKYTGVPYSAGNTTTNTPQFLIEWGAPTSNNWGTLGTAFGINAASGFTGKLFTAQVNAVNAFSVGPSAVYVGAGATATNTYATGFVCKGASSDGCELDLQNANGNGPVQIRMGNNGYLYIGASGKSVMQSDGTGHVALAAGAANGPANLDTITAANPTSETTHNTYAAQAITSQTGDLYTGYAAGGSTKVFSITVAGKGSFSNVQDTAFSAAGVVTNDSSGNFATVAPGTSGNVLTSNGSAWVSSAASGGYTPPTSEVDVYNTAGQGSTNGDVTIFSTVGTNTGSDITYATSATLGDSFTINTTGTYAITYCTYAGSASSFAISDNGSGTTAASALAVANVLNGMNIAANTPTCIPFFGTLTATHVIRPHTSGTTATSDTRIRFHIKRIN